MKHNVTFKEAVILYYQRFADFKGRSTRAEYWWPMLFVLIGMITIALTCFIDSWLCLILFALFFIASIIPSFALTTRRFHDVGLSGWWYLATIIVQIAILIWLTIILVLCVSDAFNIDDLTSADSILLKFYAIGFFSQIIILDTVSRLIQLFTFVVSILPSGKGNKYGPNPYMQ